MARSRLTPVPILKVLHVSLVIVHTPLPSFQTITSMSSTPSINGTQVIVDDRDPRIAYSSGTGAAGWAFGGEPQAYNTTIIGTNSQGNIATFQFNGVSIE